MGQTFQVLHNHERDLLLFFFLSHFVHLLAGQASAISLVIVATQQQPQCSFYLVLRCNMHAFSYEKDGVDSLQYIGYFETLFYEDGFEELNFGMVNKPTINVHIKCLKQYVRTLQMEVFYKYEIKPFYDIRVLN